MQITENKYLLKIRFVGILHVGNTVSIKSNSNKFNILGNIYHRAIIMLENKKVRITDDTTIHQY